MRAVVQRVTRARVDVEGETVGAIERGLLVFLGFGKGDTGEDLAWTIAKVIGLRIFAGDDGKMTLGVADVAGGLLLVSQFTLYGDLRRGRRPSFDDAMPPAEAEVAYGAAIELARASGLPVATGRFGAHMVVDAVNDGPVTLWLDSAQRSAGGR